MFLNLLQDLFQNPILLVGREFLYSILDNPIGILIFHFKPFLAQSANEFWVAFAGISHYVGYGFFDVKAAIGF